MSDRNNQRVGRRSLLQSIGAFGALVGLGGITSATPGREPGPKKDELIVGVDSDVSNIEAVVEPKIPSNAKIVHTNETLGYAAVEIADEASIQAKETVLDADEVTYSEDNVTYEAIGADPQELESDADTASTLYTPNDPNLGSQYAPQQVNAPEAWETTLGDPDVTISIVDQGVQYDHPDLSGNMDRSVSNGGSDFVDNDGDPYPVSASENHGTHVAGIAAGGTDNGTGHAGISNCSLLSARALGDGQGGSLSDIADAIQWSADQGADIINMSLGGGGATQLMREACQYAKSQGALLVAAAGNDYGSSVSYPAAHDSVVAVSSLDEGETLSDFSNLGPEIELAAPGDDVLSSVPWDDYDYFPGTSMASPVVAGVAGLTLSAWPNLSNEQLRTHLQDTAVDVGLSGNEQGSGRVDAGNAVTTEPGSSPDPNPDPGECGDEVNTASADGELSGGWGGNPSDTYTYQLQTVDPCSATITLEGPTSADFDLYLTVDGRTPTISDYDERSASEDSNETIEVDLTGSEAFGLLVSRYTGSGSYTMTVDESGR
ncbi:S8 family serine peptidase [Natrinema sp. SYSU A 869]|uniref:S8 family serine peptidase n=1 Tax=Natrinema sp. SYSU A 869 TaxID=2871694 RepID=UPI001CA38752|nr:S8 family serine peptidase [Natrinema sp. SYSU A 869]